jgi:hypothetical protein
MRAETLAEHGFFDEAIVVARAATDAAAHGPPSPAAVAESGPIEAVDLRAEADESIRRARLRITPD